MTHVHKKDSRGDSGNKSLSAWFLNLIRWWHLHKHWECHTWGIYGLSEEESSLIIYKGHFLRWFRILELDTKKFSEFCWVFFLSAYLLEIRLSIYEWNYIILGVCFKTPKKKKVKKKRCKKKESRLLISGYKVVYYPFLSPFVFENLLNKVKSVKEGT